MRRKPYSRLKILRHGAVMAALPWLLVACCSTLKPQTTVEPEALPATAQTERAATSDTGGEYAVTEAPNSPLAVSSAPAGPLPSPDEPKSAAAPANGGDEAPADETGAAQDAAPPAVMNTPPAVAEQTAEAKNEPPPAPEKAPVVANKPAAEQRPAVASDPTAAATKSPPASQRQARLQPPQPALNLDGLEQRLRKSKAVGLFTKLEIKSEVEKLLDEVQAFHQSRSKLSLGQLKERFNLLVMKLLVLLENGDPKLHRDLAQARPALWTALADPVEFSSIKGP